MASNEDYLSSTSSDGAVLQRPSKIFRLLSDSEESSSSSSSDMIRASTVVGAELSLTVKLKLKIAITMKMIYQKSLM